LQIFNQQYLELSLLISLELRLGQTVSNSTNFEAKDSEVSLHKSPFEELIMSLFIKVFVAIQAMPERRYSNVLVGGCRS